MAPDLLTRYLERVGLNDPPERSPVGLQVLHRAQFFSIPFENLDIALGAGVSVKPETVAAKLLDGRRGGYCFELNGLHLQALLALEFDARALLARVHLEDPPSGRTHQLSLVDFDGEAWVTDVGFGGGGPRVPLRLVEGVTEADGAAYRLDRVDPWGWMMSTRDGNAWKRSYSFDLAWTSRRDIELGNFYTSHSPQSHFTRQVIVSLPTATGRTSLQDLVLTLISNGASTRRDVAIDHYLGILSEVFGIELHRVPPSLR